MEAVSLVSARIAPERRDEVLRAYRAVVGSGLPPAIRETLLLVDDDGTLAIATVWRSREALDAVRLGPEEPSARRVLRELRVKEGLQHPAGGKQSSAIPP